ncbi:hypothetical protein GF359_03005 [candidate division WOR-3 bacterium]|uniref:Uncharacterized protein n=1 Tax=candidate division WOR-3 bacterium TaxID=2052148 RepID=A0A9D5K8C1_UNCW3|nr:hypothetical protein [candidate division WOR-3 bacterium]MBD3364163.1 hypothetical protein [candidate division WOR-3 bacterium]
MSDENPEGYAVEWEVTPSLWVKDRSINLEREGIFLNFFQRASGRRLWNQPPAKKSFVSTQMKFSDVLSNLL